MNFPGDPWIDFPVPAHDSFGPNETGGVKDSPWPLRVYFQHRPALDVEFVFLCLSMQLLRVGIWNRNGKIFPQFFERQVRRRNMCEFWKNHQLDGHEGCVADHRMIDHS